MSLRGHHRTPHDTFYTPRHATEGLLVRARELGLFKPGVECWEPAAGAGHIARVLADHGHPVLATDVAPAKRQLHPVTYHDFLTSSGPSGHRVNIITNPPYGRESRLAIAFITYAFELMTRQGRHGAIAMLLPFEFDSRTSRNWMVGEHPWFVGKLTVYKRIKWANVVHTPGKGPMGHHSWFLWSTERDVQLRARRLPMMVSR